MKAQEWLYWHDNFTFHPEYDTYFVAKVCEAAAIIRAQHERIEMLERAVESVLDVVSDDYCPTTEKCPEYGKLVRNCRAHWRKWLMEVK